jgi:hypothetical protein
MTTFIDQLIHEAKQDGREKLVQGYLKRKDKEHGDLIQRYLLWGEYLKRSKGFIETCQWFQEAKAKHPYPEEVRKHGFAPAYLEDYLFFIDTYDRQRPPLVPLKTGCLPLVRMSLEKGGIFRDMLSGTLFGWAAEAGFPAELRVEMLMNLFVFGNVSQDPVQALKLRAIKLIEARNMARAFRIEEGIDTIFGHIESDNYMFLGDAAHTVDDFKNALRRFLSSDIILTVCLVDPYENTDKTLEAVKVLINERRKKLSELGIDFSQLQGDQFECPTPNLRMDELKTYLKVFDLRQKGKKMADIAKELYPDRDANYILVREISRYRQKAEKILANVENGFFPGKYS